MSLIIRCDWCGAETDDVTLAVDDFEGCQCCAQPKAYAYGPHEWYRRHNAANNSDMWECPSCSAKRFDAQQAKIDARYARIDEAQKRAVSKARFGDDDA